jgi:hypothetical protein
MSVTIVAIGTYPQKGRLMTHIEYTKRLEEILDEQFKRLDGTTVLPIYNRPTAVCQAITAIQQLNNEAMPQKKDATDGKDYFYSPEVKIAVANYNQAIDELRAVIGASND